MKTYLIKYKSFGYFSFNFSKPYTQVCNAPNDKSGVYLIYKVENNTEVLIYIGSSGQKDKDGKLKTRKGGLYDRLTNGYHPNKFGEEKRIKRKIALPNQMKSENISEIKIYWWVTFDNEYEDFPGDVESNLRNIYLKTNSRLPNWHQQK